jgi:type IV pilus assembly protein PilQ
MTKIRANIAALILATIGLTIMLFGCASHSPRQAAEPPSAQLTHITSVATETTADEVRVTIIADGPLTFSSLKQPDPPSVVLYFPHSSVARTQVAQPVANALIPLIVARQGNGNTTSRIEVQLSADVPYIAVQEGNAVRLSFDRATAERAMAAPATTVAANPAPAPAAAVATNPTPATVPAVSSTAVRVPVANPAIHSAAPRSANTAWVNKIDFLSESDGKSTLVVRTTETVDFNIKKVTPERIEIHLLNTAIPDYRQRPLITTRFNSAVNRVLPVQLDNKKESVISIEMRESVPYVAEQAGNLLFVHFEASRIPPKPLEQAQLPAWQRVLSGTDRGADIVLPPMEPKTVTVAYDSGSGSIGALEPLHLGEELYKDDTELQMLLGQRRKTFTGEKIALDFYDTDIKNVFRILREVSGQNFAIDRDVTGRVTMTLDKPVPWDQVLDLVLRMNQLGMVHEGAIVRIATVETLKREEDLRRSQLEALRKAREEVKALEPLVTRYIAVSYSNAATEIRPHLENILTQGRGSVTVDSKNNQIIITDTVAVVKHAEEVVRRIDKVTAQVVIEARVVEVTTDFSRELGIIWNAGFGPGLLGDFAVNTDMAMNFPSQSASNIGINFSRLSGVPFVLNARLNALESTGEGRILSSPKIMTLDNKKARIKQGLEFPYLERDSAGGSSVKFKDIDLLLEVTPQVTPDNRISMTIFITKNDVATITAGVPSVSTNEAETELLVNDGDTIVIGGIIKASETLGQDGFPGLARIPVLGWMFKNTTRKQSNNELLIFITPRIVQLEQAVAQSRVQ